MVRTCLAVWCSCYRELVSQTPPADDQREDERKR